MDNQFLFKLNDFLDKEIENNEKYGNAVVVLAVELDSSGRPNGTINKVFAPPFAALGMIDYLHGILETLRENVMEKLNENQTTVEDAFPDMSELFSRLPSEIGDLLEKYDDEIKDLILKGDKEGLEDLKKRMFEEYKQIQKDKGEDPDDFNINDFIGGF